MRSLAFLALLGAFAITMACVPKPTAPPVVSAPRFPDFVRPSTPQDLAGSRAAAIQDRAWLFLQSGDLPSAEREVADALKASATFYPAEATAGYVALARNDADSAITQFDAALSRNPAYAPALAGKGQALESLGREDEAIAAWSAALAADHGLVDAQRRIDVMKFRSVQRDVAAARLAARSGKREDALQAYRTAIERSPDTAFLYRELAAIERENGDMTSALTDFRKAVALDSTDTTSLRQVAELLEAQSDFDGALIAYGNLLALEPDPAVEARRDAVKVRAEAANLPPQYRAIEEATQVTRADLAALVGVRLRALLQVTRSRDVGVMTDVRGHWAEPWILNVAGAGVIDPFADHTFQPQTPVLRVDLAVAVTQLLSRVAVVEPVRARSWANARGRFPDVAPSHLAYLAISAATASGVMTADANGSFAPTRPVTGREAIETVERLRAMAPPAGDALPR